ncbi:MAG: hypothetical protein Q7U57_18725 [Methylovulum sp.]|nr:hypothetical protein [Methylovulum sp.]
MKPHRIKYWLNHEVEDEAAFRQDVRNVCKLYHQAQELHESGVHVVSVDEKTGIQALERIHPDQAMESGKLELHEFEYNRHGTQTLIATMRWLPIKSSTQLSATRGQKSISEVRY